MKFIMVKCAQCARIFNEYTDGVLICKIEHEPRQFCSFACLEAHSENHKEMDLHG